ncbi:MAG: DUF167 domain-containing protein [Candidatus Methylacidiphilales bacterium]
MVSCVIKTRVIPGARKTEFVGLMDDGETWRIRLASPPVEGRANQALIRWLSQTLSVPCAAIQLVGGVTSREKRVRIEGLTADEVVTKLSTLKGK